VSFSLGGLLIADVEGFVELANGVEFTNRYVGKDVIVLLHLVYTRVRSSSELPSQLKSVL